MDLTHLILTISAILIFKFERDEIGIRKPPPFLNFISLDFERICRYLRFNLLVPRSSREKIVIPFLYRESKSQDKSHFHYLSLIPDQDEFLSIEVYFDI